MEEDLPELKEQLEKHVKLIENFNDAKDDILDGKPIPLDVLALIYDNNMGLLQHNAESKIAVGITPQRTGLTIHFYELEKVEDELMAKIVGRRGMPLSQDGIERLRYMLNKAEKVDKPLEESKPNYIG